MKRILAVLIAVMMLLGMTAAAESASVELVFGPYTYDTIGSEEYGEVDNGYSMIEYGDYVVTVEFFDLASNGFDQSYFDSMVADGSADSWEIGELLLSVKYAPDVDSPIYAWYTTEPTDTSYPVDAVLYNGALTEELGSGLMAGIGFVNEGTLLLVEVVSFGDYDLASLQALRDEKLANIKLNGSAVTPGASTGSAFSVPSINPFAGLLNNTTTTEEAPQNENVVTFGSFGFDTTGCESVEQDGNFTIVDYGSKVIYIEYGTFEENGASFQEVSDMYGGGLTCADMAQLFLDNSDYMEVGNDMYTNGCYDYPSYSTYPDSAMFYGNLTDEYGGGYVTGCILCTETEIVFFECISFEFGATLSDMQTFRAEALSGMTYNGAPVIK